MCRRMTCSSCGKPSFSGCGRHVDQVLADVPAAERCRCQQASATPPAAKKRAQGGILKNIRQWFKTSWVSWPAMAALPLSANAFAGGCTNRVMDHAMMGHGATSAPDVIDLPTWEGPFETAAAPDLDPADDAVEVRLEAKETEVEIASGHRVRMWTYNGVLPGPRIEARVGNTVRVRFRNLLPEGTTIHWHGLRVPNSMDGAPMVQTPIAPGSEFTYEFVVPDAGTFWYHPHVRSDEQVERGLYGAIVVRGPNEPATTTDRVVVLDDVLIDPASWQLAPFDSMMQAVAGRQGNVLLANGRAHPVADTRPGGLHRFRFVNAANARYFRLALPGQRLIMIGTDGGLLEAPREVDEVLLTPGERADVLVVAGASAGSVLEWKTLSYDRGHMTGILPDAAVFEVRNTTEPSISAPSVPPVLSRIPELPAATVRRELKLEESMGGHSGHGGSLGMGPVFSINGYVYPETEQLRASLGAVEDWSIINTTAMDHPFHLHGFRFQVVSEAGVVPAFRAWRDTVNVPAMQTVILRVRFDSNPGTWMFHCHILEHAERGMAGELTVTAP
jgi:FtsP/CotA-like multicopper oxidase with cupredoxin domain